MPEPFDLLRAALASRYTLERDLATGGTATVYLARESHPNRQVAIKVLHPAVTAHLGRERFLREVDLASKLTHPHIVPIFAAGEAADTLYYVMPYVAGESLRQRLNREGTLRLDDALRIAQDVADALEYAHRQGVVHRDVKPDNILLHEHHALVADFGIARAIDFAGGSGVTAEGYAVGTPPYMSPEQCGGSRQVDARSDVYSLACVLYEMLAGEPPFQGRSAQAIISRQLSDPVPPLRTVRSTVPSAIESVILRALAKTPADRYASAAEFATALAAAQARPLTPSKTPAASARVWLRSRWVRRGAVGVAAASLLTSMILLALSRAGPSGGQRGGAPRYAASVAVLPFDNLTGRPDLNVDAEAITDEIISQLAQVRDLKVISRNSVVALRGAHLTTPVVAETLGVGNIIEGSLRLDGAQAVVTIQLVDSTDAHLWTDRVERQVRDLPRSRTEIGRLVTARFLAGFPGLSAPAVAAESQHSLGEVFFLSGQLWLKRRTADGLRRAISAFDSALTIDSGYAAAYAELSKAYSLSTAYRYDIGVPAYRAAGLALAFAERAVALDPRLAAGYEARGYVGSRARGPTAAVARDFERARTLNPNAPDAASWYALVLGQQGLTEEALNEAQRAIALDPLSPPRWLALAIQALAARRYELAIEAARVAASRAPELMLPRAALARALLLAGRPEQCLGVQLGPHAGIRAMCLHSLGKHLDAAAIADSLGRGLRAGAFHDSVFTDVIRAEDLASYCAWTGDAPCALTWVQRAFELSPLGVETRLLQSAIFDKVRDQPVFQSGARKVLSVVWDRVRRESGA